MDPPLFRGPQATSMAGVARSALRRPSKSATPRLGPDASRPRTIAARQLGKAFRLRRSASLDAFVDVSLKVHAGEFLGIIGPSGCSKTTLLHVLAGLVPETEGSVLFDGTELPALERTQHVAYMFQKDLLLPWKRVVDNVALGLRHHGVSS